MKEARSGSLTLLVVDDSPRHRRMLRDIAVASGRYDVVGEAGSAAEAVKLYRELRPAVVLLDIVMPETDGIEAVRQILGVDPVARIVMVSSLGQEALVMESLVAGAAEYVAKPFDAESVISALDQVAARPSG